MDLMKEFEQRAVTAGFKITVTVSPELKATLDDYAEIYRRTYGQKETVAELIPFMLDSFVNADAGFKRSRKALQDEAAAKSAPAPSPTPARKE